MTKTGCCLFLKFIKDSVCFLLQFEQAYASRRLGNWEIPKWQTRDPPRPRQRKGSTQFIANEKGHLLDGSKKYFFLRIL